MRLIDSSSILGKVDICMDYKSKVKELIEYPREANWYEFKTNWYEPAGIGEYISSLSNAAALEGREAGYLVWGVDNDTHEIILNLYDRGKNAKEISEITGYAETTVHAYLPRVRPAYNENISENAKRIKKYRQNK